MNISFLIVSCFFVMFLYCCTLYVYMFFVCCILCVINDDKSFVSNGACTKSRYRKLHIFLWGGAIPSSGTYPTWRAFLALRDNSAWLRPCVTMLGRRCSVQHDRLNENYYRTHEWRGQIELTTLYTLHGWNQDEWRDKKPSCR